MVLLVLPRLLAQLVARLVLILKPHSLLLRLLALLVLLLLGRLVLVLLLVLVARGHCVLPGLVLLVLLIIFMVITPLVQKGIDVKLPETFF